MRRKRKRILFVGIALAVLAVAGFGYYEQHYPYGWSHCCDKQLGLALWSYAECHDGWFPKGEATPEASLSLLHRDAPELATANLLRGKTVPLFDVQAKLSAGELLDPESCGWHYVEGLRMDDDRELALFWDKVGLGHNGERISGGGHMVGFIDGTCRWVSGDQWEQFLANQEQLRANIKRR